MPEFAHAVPVYDPRLPSSITNLPNALTAERCALTIGVARVLKNPAEAAIRLLEACDEFGRKKAMALIDRWPFAIRAFVQRAVPHGRKRGKGGRMLSRIRETT